MFAQPADKVKDKKSPYEFTVIKDLPNTSVKNQFRTGTCWSFSSTSFLEAELLRTTKKEYDLSDMWSVYCTYLAKADRYARLHGETNFPTGGACGDVLWTMTNYGLVPESVYNGLQYGEPKHNHKVLTPLLKESLKLTVDQAKTLDSNWKFSFVAILNAYLGAAPKEFTYEGKKYTPQSFASSLKLNASDYVGFTSYTHHPFYTQFAVEVPDNWLQHQNYNVTLEEFQQIAQNAIENGYTFVWGGDVSSRGFSYKNGIAIVADEDNPESLAGTDRDRWESLNKKERTDAVYKFETLVAEKAITQEERQKAYDYWDATDDHGMHAVGLAKDQNGNVYFKIKNSWDTDNLYGGYLYMSMPFFKLNTLDILVHKNAVPAAIKAKLGIK
ncbi:aminopeptidase [Bacteroidia bacterium]|nr:aminopeptidase [Bacteroidia bacterium]